MPSLQRTIAGCREICVNARRDVRSRTTRCGRRPSHAAGQGGGFAVRLPSRDRTETACASPRTAARSADIRLQCRLPHQPSLNGEVCNCRIASDFDPRESRQVSDRMGRSTRLSCSDREISAETPAYPRNEDQKRERRRGDKLICRFTHSFAEYHDGRSSRRVAIFARPR
jgi:hypothetical protein